MATKTKVSKAEKDRRKFYKKIVRQYGKDADQHFQQCKVIPDAGDLAYCIMEFWNEDTGADFQDDDWRGLFEALGGVSDEEDNDE